MSPKEFVFVNSILWNILVVNCHHNHTITNTEWSQNITDEPSSGSLLQFGKTFTINNIGYIIIAILCVSICCIGVCVLYYYITLHRNKKTLAQTVDILSKTDKQTMDDTDRNRKESTEIIYQDANTNTTQTPPNQSNHAMLANPLSASTTNSYRNSPMHAVAPKAQPNVNHPNVNHLYRPDVRNQGNNYVCHGHGPHPAPALAASASSQRSVSSDPSVHHHYPQSYNNYGVKPPPSRTGVVQNVHAQHSVPAQQRPPRQHYIQQQHPQYANRFVPSAPMAAVPPPPKPMQIMVTSPKQTHPSQSVLSDRTSPGTECTDQSECSDGSSSYTDSSVSGSECGTQEVSPLPEDAQDVVLSHILVSESVIGMVNETYPDPDVLGTVSTLLEFQNIDCMEDAQGNDTPMSTATMVHNISGTQSSMTAIDTPVDTPTRDSDVHGRVTIPRFLPTV
eukprot:337292_1